MKKIITITFLLLIRQTGFAQSRQLIDSLQHALSVATQDSSRVNNLIGLCNQYRNIHPDSAILFGQQADSLATAINFPKGRVNALAYLGAAYLVAGNFSKNIELQYKALQMADKYKLETETPFIFNWIGQLYFEMDDYPKALAFTKKAIAVFEKENRTNEYFYFLGLMNVGTQYEEMNKLDSALYYHMKALLGFEKNKIEVPPQVYRHLGNVQFKYGHMKPALEFFRISLQGAKKREQHRFIAVAYEAIALLYQKTNQQDSGIYYANRALSESELAGYTREIIGPAFLLSALYDSTDTKRAFYFYKKATTVRDSVYSAGNLQGIQNIVAAEEERQKEIAAAENAYQNKLKEYGLLAGLAVFLLIALILFRNNKRQQKANALLHQQKEEIQTTLSQLKSTQAQLIQSEKMASLGELTAGIAHEIQNPLNFVNNFSEVSNELIDEMNAEIDRGDIAEAKTIAKDIKQNLEKINHHGKRADAIVKGMLQHSQSGKGQKEPTNINALADEYLRLAYHGFRAKDNSFNATLKTDFDETIDNINIVPQDIGRVLLNLYNNAFYAVKEKSGFKNPTSLYEPVVSVSTRKVGDKIEISVRDNGGGITKNIVDKIFQPFFTTKPTGQGTGLGLSLAYDIVKAHGGGLRVATKEAGGSEFIIQLPII